MSLHPVTISAVLRAVRRLQGRPESLNIRIIQGSPGVIILGVYVQREEDVGLGILSSGKDDSKWNDDSDNQDRQSNFN